MNMAMTWIVALALTLFGVAQAQQGKLICVDYLFVGSEPWNIFGIFLSFFNSSFSGPLQVMPRL